MSVPDDCTIICDPNRGVFEVRTRTEGSMKTTYKLDVIIAQQASNYASRSMKATEFVDRTMSGGSGIGGVEPDKMAELENPEKEMKEMMHEGPEKTVREGGDQAEN